MKYIIVGLSTMLLGLFLGAIGMLAYQKYTTPTPIPPISRITPITPTPTFTQVDPTANWKTYTNKITQYSIKYPANWQLIDLTDGKQIEIYSQPDKTKPVGELLIENTNSIGGTELYNEEKLIGTSSAKCKTDGVTKMWCYIRINANSYVSLLITMDEDIEYNKTLERILSTFSVIQKDNTSSSHTYTNSTYRYLIQIPREYSVITPSAKEQSQLGVLNCITLTSTNTCVITFNILSNSQKLPLREYLVSQGIISTHVQEESLTISGSPAIKVLSPVNGGQTSVYILKDTVVYIFTQSTTGNSQDEYNTYLNDFNTILTSFSFLK